MHQKCEEFQELVLNITIAIHAYTVKIEEASSKSTCFIVKSSVTLVVLKCSTGRANLSYDIKRSRFNASAYVSFQIGLLATKQKNKIHFSAVKRLKNE